MKSIQQIREAYNIATNLSEAEDRKLSSLVELGLLDAKKLPALKESLNKPVEQMTGSEKRLFLNLLESVLSEMQVKQSKDIKDYYATPDPRVKRAGYPSQKEAPSVLLLKRKAIRVFPDGQKVALYYAQAIDKYVSIPYNEIGINEQAVAPSEREPEEEPSSNTSSSSTGTTRKFSEPMKAGATRLAVGAPGNPQDVRIRTGLDATMERLNRKAQAAMARDVRESFHNKLDVLKEAGAPRPPKGYVPPKIRPKAGIGPGGKVAPEKSTWEKLTDIEDDGTVTGLGKDLLPIVSTARQAKRTGEAYKKTKSDFEKGDYWGTAKGAADTALQGGLTALSGLGDVATATGLGGAVVTPIRGAIAASRAARTAKNVEKFLQTAKTVPVAKAPAAVRPALPAPETKTVEPKANISAEKARKIRNATDAELANARQASRAEAGRQAEKFRQMYPKTKDTSVSPTAKEPKEFKPQVSTVTREPVKAKVSVKEREPIDFKLAKPATSKGQLVPVSAREPVKTKVSVTAREPAVTTSKVAEPKVKKSVVPVSAREPEKTKISVSAREPDDLKYNKSTVGKFPEVKSTTSKKDQTQVKAEPQTETRPKKQKTSTTPTKTKFDDEGTGKREPKSKPRFGLPNLSLKMPPKTPLQPMTPSLKLAVMAPSGKAYTSLDASDLIRARKAMIAQASVGESVNLDGNLFELNNKTAEKVTALYESLNKKNKKKMIEMMNESAESLEKVISFAVRQ